MLSRKFTTPIAVIFLLFLFSESSPAGSFAPAPGEEGWTVNKALSRSLSSRLASPVKVVDVGPFRVIASRSYEEKMLADVIPNLVEAVAEFRSFFGIGQDAPLWVGEGACRLVMLEKRSAYQRYVGLFVKEVDPDQLTPGFSSAILDTQSFYWIEPTPYAVCCGQGAGFIEVKQHLFHLLGHILLICHDYNFKYMPPWFHEGFGARTAVRYGGGNILYCRQGLNNALFGTGVFAHLTAWARSENWPAFILRESRRKGGISLAGLIGLPMEEFEHKDAALSCSLVSFLIEKHPKGLREFVSQLKKMPGSREAESVWIPVEQASTAFVTALGMGTAELEAEWKEWIGADHAEAEGNGSGSKGNGAGETEPGRASKNSAIRFDPGLHLEEFARFEKEAAIAAELAPYVERTGLYVTPEMMEKIRASWARTRERLLLAGAGVAFQANVPPGLKEALAGRGDSPDAAFYTDEEVLKLIEYIPSAECFRSVTGYLVKKHGCAGAFTLLKRRFDGDLSVLAGTDLKEDVLSLERAAAFETGLFKGLAAAKAALKLDLYSSRLKLIEAGEETLVLRARKTRNAKYTPPPGVAGCSLDEKAEEVEIRCPRSCVSLNTLLKQAKSVLKMKTDEDRIGFCRLCVFYGDGAAFKKEVRVVKGSEALKAKLKGLLGGYMDAQNGADLLTLLAGAVACEPGDRTGRLAMLLAATGDSDLCNRIEERMKKIVRRLVIENCLVGKCAVPGLEGFQGMEDDGVTARFVYDFDNPGELGAFDLESFPVLRSLRNRYSKVAPDLVVDPCRLEGGCLALGGGAFLAHKGVFSGDTEVTLHLKVSRRKGDAKASFYYILFGYGLDAAGAYIASSGLTHLDVQNSIYRDFKHLPAAEGERNAESEEGSVIVLKGFKDRIVHTFNGAEEYSFDIEGHRTGRVFLWVYGARMFHVEKIEIKALIDPDWLKRAVESAVHDEFRRLL
jgi:hypothetical protein